MAGFGEAEEFVVIAVLVTAAEGEVKALILDGNEPTPIFGEEASGGEPVLGQLCGEILGEAFSPEPRVELFLFTFVRRELRGSEGDLGFHFGVACGWS